MGMHVAVYGNPIDGITIVGPFKSQEEAHDFGEQKLEGHDWWTTPLLSAEAPFGSAEEVI